MLADELAGEATMSNGAAVAPADRDGTSGSGERAQRRSARNKTGRRVRGSPRARVARATGAGHLQQQPTTTTQLRRPREPQAARGGGAHVAGARGAGGCRGGRGAGCRGLEETTQPRALPSVFLDQRSHGLAVRVLLGCERLEADVDVLGGRRTTTVRLMPGA